MSANSPLVLAVIPALPKLLLLMVILEAPCLSAVYETVRHSFTNTVMLVDLCYQYQSSIASDCPSTEICHYLATSQLSK